MYFDIRTKRWREGSEEPKSSFYYDDELRGLISHAVSMHFPSFSTILQ